MEKLKYGPYSPSRLETATCPFQFNQQYIIKRPEAKVERLPQGRGSVVHEVYEQVTKKYMMNKETIFNPVEVRKWVVDAVNRHPVAYEELEGIQDMVGRYIDRLPSNVTENSEVERKLAVKLKRADDGSVIMYTDEINGQMIMRPEFEECDYDDPEAYMRGRADILTISDDLTTLFVYDHKTQPNVEEADTFQMGIYAWVISKCYPFIQEFQTILHFARYGKYSDPYIWTKEDLYRIEEQLITRVEIIESRTNWAQAVPYKNCQYCSFILECPELRKEIEIDEQTGEYHLLYNNFKIMHDTQRAVRMAGIMNVFSEAVKTINRELREHVKNYGPVAIAGKVFCFDGKEEIHWDKVNNNPEVKAKVFEIFKKHKEDPTKWMGFSQTFTKSVWMLDNEALMNELSAALPRKIAVKFSGEKT